MIIDAAELKRRYSQRIAGARDNKAYIGPEIVFLDITNVCNLRCQFCITDHSPGNPAHFDKASFFSWEKFLGLVRDSVDLNVDHIEFVGFGEPTRHPLFRDMMRHLEQQPLYVRLFTNGTFPSDYCSDVIRGDRVTINLGAVDRQQYHDLKGKDLFDQVVANIKHLVSLRDARKPGFHIELAYVVNTVNIRQRQQMRDLASQLGVNSVDFKTMQGNEYNPGIALSEDSGGEIKRTPPVCLNGWFYMIAMSGGDFGICHRLPQMSPVDLDKWSFKEFWFSPRIMEARCSGKYGHVQKVNKGCQTCPFYDENMERAQSLNRVRRDQVVR